MARGVLRYPGFRPFAQENRGSERTEATASSGSMAGRKPSFLRVSAISARRPVDLFRCGTDNDPRQPARSGRAGMRIPRCVPADRIWSVSVSSVAFRQNITIHSCSNLWSARGSRIRVYPCPSVAKSSVFLVKLGVRSVSEVWFFGPRMDTDTHGSNV